MPSANRHAVVAALTLGIASVHFRKTGQKDVPHPVVAALGGGLMTNMPDLIEPALHPNHRRFFHSITIAVLIGMGIHKAWHWQPDTTLDRVLRMAVLIAGGAYLCHLCLDLGTRKSLPLL